MTMLCRLLLGSWAGEYQFALRMREVTCFVPPVYRVAPFSRRSEAGRSP
jgi:hypothetical protein